LLFAKQPGSGERKELLEEYLRIMRERE